MGFLFADDIDKGCDLMPSFRRAIVENYPGRRRGARQKFPWGFLSSNHLARSLPFLRLGIAWSPLPVVITRSSHHHPCAQREALRPEVRPRGGSGSPGATSPARRGHPHRSHGDRHHTRGRGRKHRPSPAMRPPRYRTPDRATPTSPDGRPTTQLPTRARGVHTFDALTIDLLQTILRRAGRLDDRVMDRGRPPRNRCRVGPRVRTTYLPRRTCTRLRPSRVRQERRCRAYSPERRLPGPSRRGRVPDRPKARIARLARRHRTTAPGLRKRTP